MSLILLPNLLSEDAEIQECIPSKIKEIILALDGVIAESEKNLRRYFLKIIKKEDFQKLEIILLNEHTKEEEFKEIIKKIKDQKWALLSDAGLPCIADPGSKLVYLARENNIDIKAISGPSSIFLALMLSGLKGQSFTFHGYLPREEKDLFLKLEKIQKEAKEYTQIFIEAPYRSDKLYKTLLDKLDGDIYLSVAINLTSSKQRVFTKKVRELKKANISLEKEPTIFLFSYNI